MIINPSLVVLPLSQCAHTPTSHFIYDLLRCFSIGLLKQYYLVCVVISQAWIMNNLTYRSICSIW